MSKPLYDDAQILKQILYDTSDADPAKWYQAGWGTDRTLLFYSIPATSPDPSTLDSGGNNENMGFQAGLATRTAWKALAVEAFELWDELIKLDMFETDLPDAQITMAWSNQTRNGGNYMSRDLYPLPAGSPAGAERFFVQAQIWLDSTDSRFAGTPARATAGFEQLLLHEIGHALGLFHPGDYDSSDATPPTYADDAVFQQDTVRLSLMSYWRETADTVSGADWKGQFALTPMVYDIWAAQTKYGADTSTRKGDDTYGFNSNLTGSVFAFTDTQQPVLSIWDAGGIDTLDLSGFISSAAMRIDLRPGSYSSVGGLKLNLGIAFGTTIENAVGGRGADTLVGNDARNILEGGAGADSLSGGFGNDAASYAGAATAVLADLAAPGRNREVATGDAYASIEDLIGSAGADSLYGTEGTNRLEGGLGNDLLDGRGGADTLLGLGGDDTLTGGAAADLLDGGIGFGFDFASYATATARVTANLAANNGPSVNLGTGDALLDWYVSFEGLIGSGFDDLLIGIDTANELRGGNGNDQLRGGGGADTLRGDAGNDTVYGEPGADSIDGGLGEDFIDYATAGGGVNVSLRIGGPAGLGAAEALGDTFSRVERIRGSAFADTIAGSTAADTIEGAAGRDLLSGDRGNDTYLSVDYTHVFSGVIYVGGFWDSITEAATGGIDTVITRRQADRFGQLNVASYTLPANVENLIIDGDLGFELVGNVLANALTGGGGNDRLVAGDAADTLTGNAGWDTMYGEFGDDIYVLTDVFDWYSGLIYVGTFRDDVLEPVGGGTDTVLVGAAYSAALGRLVSTYTLGANVENGRVTGDSRFELVGNVLNNALTGGGGDDRLVAGDGADTLAGGLGADTLYGEFGDDTYILADVVEPTGGIGTEISAGPRWDLILEPLNGGLDTVLVERAARSGAAGGFVTSYRLPDTIEVGRVTGTAGFDLFGNAAANRLTGNDAANWLLGEAGADTLLGMGGDDALGGGSEADRLSGGDGADTLEGGGGRDTLTGGVGADVFVLSLPAENDVVTDFAPGEDRLLLALASFDPGGTIGLVAGSLADQAGRFLANLTGLADTAGVAQLVYETDTGRVWWDGDGAGGTARVVVATLLGLPALGAGDVWLG